MTNRRTAMGAYPGVLSTLTFATHVLPAYRGVGPNGLFGMTRLCLVPPLFACCLTPVWTRLSLGLDDIERWGSSECIVKRKYTIALTQTIGLVYSLAAGLL